MHRIKSIIKRFVVVGLITILLQAMYFAVVLRMENAQVPSQAIVIFSGSEKRIETGYTLADQGVAPLIILSSATDSMRAIFDRKYGLPDGASHITEPHARTTLENAYFTARLIQEHNLGSVTLVTADYHMPRSLILLRWFLIGKRVTVHTFKVRADEGDRTFSTMAMLLYNEMIKSWGSLAEYAICLFSGGCFYNKDEDNRIESVMRRLLLMGVEDKW